jgi:hypothetical protein
MQLHNDRTTTMPSQALGSAPLLAAALQLIAVAGFLLLWGINRQWWGTIEGVSPRTFWGASTIAALAALAPMRLRIHPDNPWRHRYRHLQMGYLGVLFLKTLP